ncbi:MAG: hypothetical protein EOM31_03380 [Bacteroidia bacterium]|nr:hypothetical protein [Bacteroidia bacterium]
MINEAFITDILTQKRIKNEQPDILLSCISCGLLSNADLAKGDAGMYPSDISPRVMMVYLMVSLTILFTAVF